MLVILAHLSSAALGVVYRALPTGPSESLAGFGALQVLVTGALFVAGLACSIGCLVQRGSKGRILAAVALGAAASTLLSVGLSWLPFFLLV